MATTTNTEEEKKFITGYQSQYKDQIQGLYDQIANRKDFTYDVNADAMYQQLKDQYIQGGRMAMQDTMGQAQAMTGGYGNSYAQSVGQQSYQGYLQGLNDQVPNLYQMALNRYIQQGDQLKDQYSMLTAQEAQDYARWQDQQQLALQQVTEMLKKGKTPSDELIAQSGLSKEYIDSMKKKKKSSGWDPLQDAINAYWADKRKGNGNGGILENGTDLQNYDGVYADANNMLAAGKSYSQIANLVSASSLSQTEKDEILSDIRNQTIGSNPKKGNGGR